MSNIVIIKQFTQKHEGAEDELIAPLSPEESIYDEFGNRSSTKTKAISDVVFPQSAIMSVTPNVSNMKYKVSYDVSACPGGTHPDVMVTLRRNGYKFGDHTGSSGVFAGVAVATNQDILSMSANTCDGVKSILMNSYMCGAGGPVQASYDVVRVTPEKYFDAKVHTLEGQYIWVFIPYSLNINKVTCFGIDVTLEEPIVFTNGYGSFKAYRSKKALSEAEWALSVTVF